MRRLIDLRKGHPKAANLQHQRIALACRQAASRLDVASEASFPLQYTIGSFGTPRFLGRLTRFLEDSYGGRCFEDGLLTTNGVSHGIELACGALTSPGDSVWMETPSYFLAHQIFVDHGLKVQGVPSDAHGLDTDALARMLSTAELGPPPKLLYLVPSHGNPSAATLPLARRERLLALAEEYSFVVVTDDVYHLLDWSRAPVPRLLELDVSFQARVAKGDTGKPGVGKDEAALAAAKASANAAEDEEDDSYTNFDRDGAKPSSGGWSGDGRVISLGSFTKILAPGLRLGWAEASPALVKRLSARGYMVSGGSVAPFASEIVSELLQSGAQAEVLAELVADYSASASALIDAVKASGCLELLAEPRGGMFAFCTLPEGMTAGEVLPVAERHGVVFLPAAVCAPTAPAATFERCIRLCFAFEEVAAIVEGVARIKAAIEEIQAASVRNEPQTTRQRTA